MSSSRWALASCRVTVGMAIPLHSSKSSTLARTSVGPTFIVPARTSQVVDHVVRLLVAATGTVEEQVDAIPFVADSEPPLAADEVEIGEQGLGRRAAWRSSVDPVR